MLTHEVPFSADSLQRMFNDILTREPRPPRKLQPGVHPDLEAVCLKALEKSPEKRYASAQDMAADLGRFLAGETTVARPVGALGQLQRRLGRQSTLTLVVLSLLVPTAWLATDVLMRRDAAEHVGRHDVRAIVSALAGLLLAWPLAQLGTRLARGRAVGAATGFGLALLLGAGASVLALDQKTTQLHHTARGELEGRLELETAGSRADLDDLDQYVASWESRFDRDDLLLLTLGCLKRERPVQASQWAERLSSADAAADTPVEDALHAAIASALGDEAAATAAEARVRAAEGVERDWHVWARIGDILFDMQRDTEARASYERAARLPGADRDQLNLDLARVSVGLCEWDQAADVLQDVMKWQPDNPVALQLAIGIALHGDDWSGASALVDRYEGNPAVGPVGRLSQRFVLLTDAGRRDEASRLVTDARAGQGDDPLVREWCARRSIDLGREENGLAAAAKANDDAAGLERHGEAAVTWFESARADYEALTRAPGDSLIGRVGLSAALIRLVPYHADQAAALYDEAAAHARRAIELDPYYWQAHYNLGVALLSRALLDAANDESAVPAERWQAVSEALVRSVQVNGLQQPVLNDAAHALAMQCRAVGSNERLPEALGLVRRAIALGERVAEGSCTPGALDRMRLSSCWDTLSEVQEQSGDVPAALESARSALAALGPNDPGRTKRAAKIARLEQQPPATR
jgi:tetratricopeptide (TPR) repeat protein